MLSILKQNVPHIETYFESHSLEIIQELITTLFDAEKFTQCFGTDVEYVSDESTIDFGIFMKSLDYVKVIELFSDSKKNGNDDENHSTMFYSINVEEVEQAIRYHSSFLCAITEKSH